MRPDSKTIPKPTARPVKQRLSIALIPSAFLALVACSPNTSYRHKLSEICVPDAKERCAEFCVQENGRGTDSAYTLGFIEFDDQGQMWREKDPDKYQLHSIMKAIDKAQSDRNVIVVVFAHGWHHNAKDGDENIITFQQVLKRISASEQAFVKGLKEKDPENAAKHVPRRTIGVYLGWRGETLHGFPPHFLTDWIHDMTFWGRKATAHKVGYGQGTEVLCKLEKAVKSRPGGGDTLRDPILRNRFIVVGHSFGGALIYSSLSQILIQRHIEGSDTSRADPKPFGDLVLLINPAFEALKLDPLKTLSFSNKYDSARVPNFIVLQSKNDVPVHRIFPFGRFISDISESNTDSEQRNRNITAVGFYPPYVGYELKLHPETKAEPLDQRHLDLDMETLSKMSSTLTKKGNLVFNGMELKFIGQKDWDAENPYPIISVSSDIIDGHNGIDSPKLLTFVEQLIVSHMR